jgi:hypothetical protein
MQGNLEDKWSHNTGNLANEVAKGYSNATFPPSVRHILANTLGSTYFNGF